MRTARLLGEGVCFYHAVTRIVDRQFILNCDEQQRFLKLLRRLEAFSGVTVVTYALMSNHVHLLLQVTNDTEVSTSEVMRRVGGLYGEDRQTSIQKLLKVAIDAGDQESVDLLLEPYRIRMNNLSIFMKELKQDFTMSYNKRHARKGTLWESRFHSTLIEGSGAALSMTAAYIDLNPVRAGIVDDPKDYRFSGYGAANSGQKVAQEGLKIVLSALGVTPKRGWGAREYRKYLFEEGVIYEKGGTSREQFRIKAEKVIQEGGKLSVCAIVHCRLRYITAGAILGSKEFINSYIAEHQEQLGGHRKTGAHPIKQLKKGSIYVLRALRVDPITPPPKPTPPT